MNFGEAKSGNSPHALPPKRIARQVLIVGGGGIVASHLVALAPAHVVLHIGYGVHRPRFDINGRLRRIEPIRLENPLETLALIARVRPDLVINAAGMNSVDDCQRDPQRCRRMNIESISNLLAARSRHPFKLVQLSSNAVYGGTKGPYSPGDQRKPVNVYGCSKRDAEDLIRADAASRAWAPEHASMIVRLSPLYGWSPAWSRVNPLPWIHRSLANHIDLNLSNDVFDTPLAADQAARILWHLIDANAVGEFNLGGADTVSRHGFGLAVASAFGLSDSRLRGVPFDNFAGMAPRATDTSLHDHQLIAKFGIASEPLLTGLARQRNAIDAAIAKQATRQVATQKAKPTAIQAAAPVGIG